MGTASATGPLVSAPTAIAAHARAVRSSNRKMMAAVVHRVSVPSKMAVWA